MGAEVSCVSRFNGRAAHGKARLETDVLQFRAGDLRLAIPLAQISAVAADTNTLTITFADLAVNQRDIRVI
jgi:hypothetical protein